MNLVLDEHLSPGIARQLRRRGHDVVTARELVPGLDRSDAELLRRATEAGRTLVTADIADFTELHRASVISGRGYAGLVLVARGRFPPTARAIGRTVAALEALLAAHRGTADLENRIVWLEATPQG